MAIRLKAICKNIEVEVTAEATEEALTKLTEMISLIEKKEFKSSPPLEMVTPADQIPKEYFANLVRFNEDGPVILFRIEGKQVETQVKAFMTIAYMLNKFYSENKISSSRVSSLMEKSGLNTTNIHNATAAMTNSHYIVKPKGQQTFEITPQGEKFVLDFLKSEKKNLEVETK